MKEIEKPLEVQLDEDTMRGMKQARKMLRTL